MVQDFVLSATLVDLHIGWRGGRVIGDTAALPTEYKEMILKEV